MAIPILVKQLIEKKLTKFCDKRIPEQAKSQVQLEYVTLYEKRPYFLDKDKWTLFCRDRNSKWHEYT